MTNVELDNMTAADFTHAKDLALVLDHINRKESFVLNIVANWCSDCTEEQAPNMPQFIAVLAAKNIPTLQLVAQQEKREYLSLAHQQFVESLGGHGFPRTLAFVEGVAAAHSYLEVVSEQGLSELEVKLASLINGNESS